MESNQESINEDNKSNIVCNIDLAGRLQICESRNNNGENIDYNQEPFEEDNQESNTNGDVYLANNSQNSENKDRTGTTMDCNQAPHNEGNQKSNSSRNIDLAGSSQISKNNNEANIQINVILESDINTNEEEKRDEPEVDVPKRQEDTDGIDTVDHPLEPTAQLPQPRRIVKKGRSLIPSPKETKTAPRNFVDVPDYGYVGIDGSLQVPF